VVQLVQAMLAAYWGSRQVRTLDGRRGYLACFGELGALLRGSLTALESAKRKDQRKEKLQDASDTLLVTKRGERGWLGRSEEEKKKTSGGDVGRPRRMNVVLFGN